MSATADIFTAIHKAIRSMIYSLGGQLQTLDFADRGATERLLAEIRIDFASSLGANCVLCLLHAHAGSEEWGAFPQVSKVEPGLIAGLLAEHHDITTRLTRISERSTELLALDDPGARVEAGARLNREVNDFFAAYLLHMNHEETELVPAMQKHFTDEQIFAMQAAIEHHVPQERLVAYLEWLLPSLNATELTAVITGAKEDAPPELVRIVTTIGETKVDPARWKVVSARLAS